MSDLESSKTMAGIGSILLLFPFANLVGVILLYIGMKGLSEYYKDESIYKDALRGLIFLIIAAVVIAVAVPLLAVGRMFSAFALGGVGAGFGLLALLLVLVLVFVFYVLAALNLRKSFSTLSQRSGERMFETAGTLLFFGAIFTIIFVGFVLIFIAWIMATIAFFSIRTPTQTYTYTPQAAAPTQPTRYCPNCGSPVDINATFCAHCGKQLPPP